MHSTVTWAVGMAMVLAAPSSAAEKALAEIGRELDEVHLVGDVTNGATVVSAPVFVGGLVNFVATRAWNELADWVLFSLLDDMCKDECGGEHGFRNLCRVKTQYKTSLLDSPVAIVDALQRDFMEYPIWLLGVSESSSDLTEWLAVVADVLAEVRSGGDAISTLAQLPTDGTFGELFADIRNEARRDCTDRTNCVRLSGLLALEDVDLDKDERRRAVIHQLVQLLARELPDGEPIVPYLDALEAAATGDYGRALAALSVVGTSVAARVTSSSYHETLPALATLATSSTVDGVSTSLQALATPGGWRKKRERSGVSFGTMVGFGGSYEWVKREREWGDGALAAGLNIPVGVDVYLEGRLSVFLSAINLGSITTIRFDDSENVASISEDMEWRQLISLGIHGTVGLGQSPFRAALGFTYVPDLRSSEDGDDERSFFDASRLDAMLAVDIPLLGP